MAAPGGPAIHEDLRRAPEVRTSSDRTFGLVAAGALAALGALPLVSGAPVRWWALAAGAAGAALAAAYPSALRPLNRAWTWVGLTLGQVTAPIVLGLLFYGAVTPIGLLMRWRGQDPLRLRRAPGQDTYWIRRIPPGPAPDTMVNQF